MAQRALKVLLVAGRFEVRGSSAYTLRLAEGLRAHGVDVTILTPCAELIAPHRRERLPLSIFSFLDVPVWGRLVRESVVRELAKSPPDLIHVQSWSAHSTGVALSRRLKRPYVLSVQDHLGSKCRLRLDSKWARRVIAVSQSVRSEVLGRTTLAPEMVSVIHPGVDISPSTRTAAVLVPDRLPVVGTAGPLESVKGHIYFLGAAQRVVEQHADIEFLIAGSGPEEQNLRRLARELGITRNVTFIPNLYDFSTSLAAMDIFCLPSLRQALGTIMLEAMALGRPVIATGVGGISGVIRNKETGLIVSPGDSAELAERILQLLHDPVEARAIGEAGRRLVCESYATERMVAQTAEIYRDAIESPVPSAAPSPVPSPVPPPPSAPPPSEHGALAL